MNELKFMALWNDAASVCNMHPAEYRNVNKAYYLRITYKYLFSTVFFSVAADTGTRYVVTRMKNAFQNNK